VCPGPAGRGGAYSERGGVWASGGCERIGATRALARFNDARQGVFQGRSAGCVAAPKV